MNNTALPLQAPTHDGSFEFDPLEQEAFLYLQSVRQEAQHIDQNLKFKS